MRGYSLSGRLAYGSHVPWFGGKRLTADRGMLCTWRPWLGEWEGAVGGGGTGRTQLAVERRSHVKGHFDDQMDGLRPD